MIKALKTTGALTRDLGASLALHVLAIAAVMLAAPLGVKETRPIRISFALVNESAGPSYETQRSADKEPARKTETVSAKRVEPAKSVRAESPKPVEQPHKADLDTAKADMQEGADSNQAFPSAIAVSPAHQAQYDDSQARPETEASSAAADNGLRSVSDDGAISKTSIITAASVNASQVLPAQGEALKQKYMSEHFAYIRSLLMRHISYPGAAKKLGLSGDVVISFRILSDGRAEGITVLKSSGYVPFDRNAVDSVRRAQPFPPPPVSAELVVPVSYKID